MCVLFLHTNPDPKNNEYRLIVASNRDEYFQRPTKPAYKSSETGIIAGRDLKPGKEGGTWLGVAELPDKYRFGCLLNIPTDPNVPDATGRGGMVIDYLEGNRTFPEYEQILRQNDYVYNGFNLIGVELNKRETTIKVYQTSNLPRIDSEYTGRHTLGFSNSPVSSPYTKALDGKRKLEKIIDQGLDKEGLKAALLALLKDRSKCLPDQEMEKRGPIVLEKLSSIFVDFPEVAYGTRTHTIVLVDKDWNLDFMELTMEHPENPNWKKTLITSKL